MAIRSEGLAAVYRSAEPQSGVDLEERAVSPPQVGQVLVELRAASLNHLDLWITSGAQRVEAPRVIGADGAGIVVESADPRWRPGDEVVAFPVVCCWQCRYCQAGEQVLCERFGILGESADGTACQFIHMPSPNLFPKPRTLSWAEAGAFPLTFLTAWRMIATRAQLKAGETMLVIGAGAGVAAAAIAIGHHLGARVLATSRDPAKRQRAMAIGADQAFDSRDFATAVRDFTEGGADVVFEHVGPATLEQSIRSLRKGGRLVYCGATSGARAEINLPRLFLNQIDLIGSTMGNVSEFEAVLRAIDSGLRPVVDRVFPLVEITSALAHLESGEQFGKIGLTTPIVREAQSTHRAEENSP
jgi:NADPH:quinone reductase-like Zn-dependent oxidoreductase